MRFTTDKIKLAEHFKKNRVLFAYHIGDLDDFFFSLCRWPILENNNGDIDEAILIYDNPLFPTVMAFGLTDAFGPFLENALDIFPNRFFCHYRRPHGEILRSTFDEKPLGTHLKMKLDPNRFEAYRDAQMRNKTNDTIRLDLSLADALAQFYTTAYPDGYFDWRMLETGKFFGAYEQGKLAAVAGIHVYSTEYDIAVLGSIATLPGYRGKGLATGAIARLVADLYKEGKLMALNVKADNHPAIACYKKIGFDLVCEYEEALYTRR